MPKRSTRGAQKRQPSDELIEDLLDDMDDPFAALADRLVELPQAQALFEQARGILDRLGGAIDGRAIRERRQRAQARPRPAVVDPTIVARATLHFGPTEALTAAAVKKRRKELAGLCHPDRGGSKDAMAAINAAADVLLKSL